MSRHFVTYGSTSIGPGHQERVFECSYGRFENLARGEIPGRNIVLSCGHGAFNTRERSSFIHPWTSSKSLPISVVASRGIILCVVRITPAKWMFRSIQSYHFYPNFLLFHFQRFLRIFICGYWRWKYHILCKT